MPKGIYDRKNSNWKPWNKGIPRSQKVKNAVSKANKGRLLGSKHPNWKGGITKIAGRVFIYLPNHPHAIINRVRRSHLVMEQKIGRYLTSNEVVHHINEIKDDDRPENLELFFNTNQHTKYHSRQRNKMGKFISNK